MKILYIFLKYFAIFPLFFASRNTDYLSLFMKAFSKMIQSFSKKVNFLFLSFYAVFYNPHPKHSNESICFASICPN